MEDLSTQEIVYALFSLGIIVVALLLIKKVTGCLVKTIVMAVVLAVLAAIYFGFVKV